MRQEWACQYGARPVRLWACRCGERVDETIRFYRAMQRPESQAGLHARIMREMQGLSAQEVR